MKPYISIIAMILAGALIISCSKQPVSSSATEEKTEKKSRDYSRYSNLGEVLRSQGNLQVIGTHPNVKVFMRGQSTIQLETQPLYIVDNVPIGNSYVMAANAVNPVNIESIQIIRDASRLTRYGTMANHGAIIIKTKQSNKINN